MKGFTFIEVLVAMLIFVLAVLASISLSQGSVRATKEAKDITVASWLLQNVMAELETKLETEGFDKGCEKKKEAKFEAPYDRYSWRTSCEEIDFNLSQTAAQMAQNKSEDSGSNTQENLILKTILQIASQYMTKSLRELHVEIYWVAGTQKRQVDATTHVARYDQPVVIPSLGASSGTPANGGGGSK
jgi:type II secretion system protein I